MDKKSLALISVFAVLCLVLVGEISLYFRGSKNTVKVDVAGFINPTAKISPATSSILPRELVENFDPTVNTPIFKIISVDEAKKTIKLRVIFPENYAIKEVTSKISCKNTDIDNLLTEIKNNLNEKAIFSGLCADRTCKVITDGCVVNLYKTR